MRFVDKKRFLAMCRKAMDSGKFTIDFPSLNWDVSNGCESPYIITFATKDSPSISDFISNARDSNSNCKWLHVHTMCRKCDHCRDFRSYLWRTRGYSEVAESSRTWFCTFTCNPSNRVRAAIYARRKYGKEDFSSVNKIISKWFTLYLKRLRKNSRKPFRYMLVSEQHKDGFPHLHALIHERGFEISKRQIEAEWPHGFTNVKLADCDSAKYITKYISKGAKARVRASLRYGHGLSHSDSVIPDSEYKNLFFEDLPYVTSY